MIIVDENVERYFIELLRNKGLEIISVAEQYPSISDKEVIELVKKENATLITEDKDFGELVFAYHVPHASIIFLRYDQPQYFQIEKQLLDAIEKYLNKPDNYFITISKLKTRVTKI